MQNSQKIALNILYHYLSLLLPLSLSRSLFNKASKYSIYALRKIIKNLRESFGLKYLLYSLAIF